MLPAVHGVVGYEAIWSDDARFEGAARAPLRAHACDDVALTRRADLPASEVWRSQRAT